MQDLSFEERLERLQIAFANVGNGPVVEVGVSPMDQVVTFTRDDLLRFRRPRRCWPNKQINKMFAPLVNQRCYGVIIEVIKASTNQSKTLTCKVRHRSREIELRIKPGFHRVLIGGGYIHEMVGHKRTDVTGYKLCREELIGTRLL